MQSSKNSAMKPVKFKFRNIGPIKNAELELGDLTIIAGRNNTGKTYLTYTLYSFLKTWRRWSRINNFLLRENHSSHKKFSVHSPDLKGMIKKALEEGRGKCRMDREALNVHRRKVMTAITKDFSTRALPGVLSASPEYFKNSFIEVELDDELPQLEKHEMGMTSGDIYSVQYQNEELIMSVDIQGEKVADVIEESSRILFLYLNFLFPELFFPLTPLTAERFGISLFHRELDFAKNQLVDLLQKMGTKEREQISPFLVIDKSTSRYATPIKDNIDYIRSLPDSHKQRSEIYGRKLFDNVKNMAGGYYSVSSDGDIRFISKTRGEDRFNIPLHLASTSVRGLSDLYFFLRHIARPGHLLIIDEPESHLDTNNQREMARLLARMVRAGLKVLITTHSDYLIKEINSLIMLDDLNDEKMFRKLRYNLHDRIDRRSVRAYIAEKKGLTSCEIDEFGIDMPVFDKVIREINHASNVLTARIIEQKGE